MRSPKTDLGTAGSALAAGLAPSPFSASGLPAVPFWPAQPATTPSAIRRGANFPNMESSGHAPTAMQMRNTTTASVTAQASRDQTEISVVLGSGQTILDLSAISVSTIRSGRCTNMSIGMATVWSRFPWVARSRLTAPIRLRFLAKAVTLPISRPSEVKTGRLNKHARCYRPLVLSMRDPRRIASVQRSSHPSNTGPCASEQNLLEASNVLPSVVFPGGAGDGALLRAREDCCGAGIVGET